MSDLLLPEGARNDISQRQVEPANEQVGQQQRGTPGVIVQPMPCTICLLNGKQFVVPEVEGWGYVDVGVFATGHFTKAPNKELNLLIPYDRIDYYVMDFDALERYIKAQAEEAQNDQDGNRPDSPDEAQPESLGEGDSGDISTAGEGS